MEVSVLGTRALENLILEAKLDLYKEDRKRMTIEAVAEKMRTHDISVRLYEATRTDQSGARAFEVRFAYPDRYKARQVVREIVGRFEEMNYAQTQKAGLKGNLGLELLESADLPVKLWALARMKKIEYGFDYD